MNILFYTVLPILNFFGDGESSAFHIDDSYLVSGSYMLTHVPATVIMHSKKSISFFTPCSVNFSDNSTQSSTSFVHYQAFVGST